MEDNTKSMESLVENAIDFSKTGVELIKLKAIKKSSDVASTMVPHTMVLVLVILASLFINLGLAIWLGEIMGYIWLGFFAVGVFYVIIAIVVHFFMHKCIKDRLNNYIIKQIMK